MSNTLQTINDLLESGSACVAHAREYVERGDPVMAGRWFGAASNAFSAAGDLSVADPGEDDDELGETVEFDALAVSADAQERLRQFNVVRIEHRALVPRSEG
jgi:hypothetical protein